ncbi:sodium:calcium antiporter [Halosegnis rubeus]|jgi:cation:H+ antiporter|uniref:Sodium:calcium antiporter n=1 Tax=Halosegnis rubeus TaxID=2212850 RepID=A0A5N5ULN4_9EURY|nr:sodium:calcium antiporter [Halosegnis rubeus]KAB7515752.1 sodium:calcium antiporter [Halosegnis rubeus]KAB7519839.1 sodium:calcium antiporter [Halosegnis rubeus]
MGFTDRFQHPLIPVFLAVGLTLPWVVSDLTGAADGFSELTVVAVAGLAVLGASFLLAWGAETAEKDVPRAFAIAVLAVLAVAPEYAVDALYAWQAGSGGATAEACAQFTTTQIENEINDLASACHNANLAVANMTGANRILIGLGWSGIAMFTLFRAGRSADPAVESREGFLADRVNLDPSISTEIAFLFFATVWAFFVPLGGGIDILDMAVLVGLYVIYIGIILKGDVDDDDHQVGVPAYFQAKARHVRIPVVLTLFAYSGILIFTAVEPFAHGLESLGQQFGIPSFFMIQWVAPLASESPELIVVAYLVNKARSTAGFNALISSKLNQWTLLIGTLVVVFSIASGGYEHLPFDAKQSAEIWITAAQSLFALAILINFNISIREAVVLLVLFLSQVVLEFLIIRDFAIPFTSRELLLGYAVAYMLFAFVLFVYRRNALRQLFARLAETVKSVRG